LSPLNHKGDEIRGWASTRFLSLFEDLQEDWLVAMTCTADDDDDDDASQVTAEQKHVRRIDGEFWAG
jgi:hypothetical protein